MCPERGDEEGGGEPPNQIAPHSLFLQHGRGRTNHEWGHARAEGLHEGLRVHESPWTIFRVVSALEHPLHKRSGSSLWREECWSLRKSTTHSM